MQIQKKYKKQNLSDHQKNVDGINLDRAESIFILTIFKKNERNEIKILLRKCKSIIKMVSYQEARIKLTNIQSNKSKFAGKHKKGTILKINKKNFQDKVLLYELFLTTRQATKVRNAFKIICQQMQNLVKLKYLK